MPRPLAPLAETSTIRKARFSEDASSSLTWSSASAALPRGQLRRHEQSTVVMTS